MAALHIPTPLVESLALSRAAGRRVWLKLEALQPPGSFKIRGVGAACQAYHARGARRFVSSSGGNAGLAVAYAGRKLGVPVQVVVPQSATARARELLAAEGAEVTVHGASWQEANALAQSLLAESDAYIHPFDDPLLWPGHATLIDEVAAAGLRPGAVLVSVGGGGLMCGVIEGLRRNAMADVPVWAVETDGAASLNAALKAGQRVTLDAITSIATSLGAKQVCEQAFKLAQSHPLISLLVSDREAVNACLRFMDDHRLVVEPACGAALAPAYFGAAGLPPADDVLAVVCGGATATAEQLFAWAAQLR
ncbi:MAG TPA: pyridoxal-phosphate dependent enzyme [Ideonella sp.]|jgi:L-serine/L-threonine ammonia-lyase|nr:pyridoxal-phosphate dependent enzyme [Ideonella sp.]